MKFASNDNKYFISNHSIHNNAKQSAEKDNDKQMMSLNESHTHDESNNNNHYWILKLLS